MPSDPATRVKRFAGAPGLPVDDSVMGAGARLTLIPVRWKMAYSAGAWIDGVAGNALQTFALFYVTTVLGVPGSLAGVALSAGLVVDALLDPLIGSVSDGWHSKLGRRLPFMLLGLPLATIAFQLFFTVSGGMSSAMTFAVVLALSIVLRSSISLFNLPFLAFGAELTDDYVERSTLAAWRWGFGMFGGIVVVGVGFGIFFKDRASSLNPGAYAGFATTCASIAAIGALVSMWATYRLRARSHPAVAPLAGVGRTLAGSLVELAQNPSFRVLFFSTVLFFVAEGASLALGLHVNTYFWRLASADIKLVMGAFFLGLVAGAPVAARIARRMDKKVLVMRGVALLAIAQAAPVAFRLTGLLPLQGRWLAGTLVADNFLIGMALSAAAIAANSMLADAADEHEYLFGQRREGLFFAGWAFAVKAASGGGALLAGFALAISGFSAARAPHEGTRATAVSAHTADLLALFQGPASSVLCVVGLVVMARYTLSRERHAFVLSELDGRRRTANAALDISPGRGVTQA